jgi:hypothetical protein
MATDQPRSGPRSWCGTQSRLPMTSIGIRAANSSMKLNSFFSDKTSSNRSTSRVTSDSMRAIAFWLTAPMMMRRTRVCSGGSLNTRLVVWCS